jgi:integrase
MPKEIFCCPQCKYYLGNRRKKDGKYKCYKCGNETFTPETRLRDCANLSTRNKKRSVVLSDIQNKGNIQSILSNMSNTKNTKRDSAFIAFLYLTGARISEVLGLRSLMDNSELTPAIRKKQIVKEYSETEPDKIRYIIIKDMPVLKRRAKKAINLARNEVMNYPVRNCLIPYEKEKHIWAFVERHLDTLHEDDRLFNFRRSRGWKIINEFSEAFPHFFRHLRGTHLVNNYNFSTIELQTFYNWSTPMMSSKYIHTNESLLRNKF